MQHKGELVSWVGRLPQGATSEEMEVVEGVITFLISLLEVAGLP